MAARRIENSRIVDVYRPNNVDYITTICHLLDNTRAVT